MNAIVAFTVDVPAGSVPILKLLATGVIAGDQTREIHMLLHCKRRT